MDDEMLNLIREIRSSLRTFNMSETPLDKLVAKIGSIAQVKWYPVTSHFLENARAIGVDTPAIVSEPIRPMSPINPMS